MSSLSVRAFGLSTWRNFWTTASFDKSSTNLTNRASSFGPISVASEALSPLRLGMMRYNYFKQIRHKIVNLLPRSKVTPRQPFCERFVAVPLVTGDICLSNPCQNAATCEFRDNSYSCKCSQNYLGTHCASKRIYLSTNYVLVSWFLDYNNTPVSFISI